MIQISQWQPQRRALLPAFRPQPPSLTRPMLPLASSLLAHRHTMEPLKGAGAEATAGLPQLFQERTKQGDILPPGAQESSSHSQASFGRENLQKKCPQDVPSTCWPLGSSLSPHQAGPQEPGPPDCPSDTTVSCPANPGFLLEGVTQRQGLAPAQTIRSAASHMGEGGGRDAEDVIQFCQCLCSTTGLGMVPGGSGRQDTKGWRVTAWPSRSSQSRPGSKPGTSDPNEGLHQRKGP